MLTTLFILLLNSYNSPDSGNIRIYLFDKTKKVYSTEIDSIVCQSKTQRIVFNKIKKNPDTDYILLSDLNFDNYDIIIYRFYYQDKILKNIEHKSRLTKAYAEFDVNEKLELNKAVYPGDFDCTVTKIIEELVGTNKKVEFISSICFQIDTIGKTKAFYIAKPPPKNKSLELFNKKLEQIDLWIPASLKGKKLNSGYCFSFGYCK